MGRTIRPVDPRKVLGMAKINRIVCDLCPGDAPRTASNQIKLYTFNRPVTRGAPPPEFVFDLCAVHNEDLENWLSMKREVGQ